MLGQTIVGRSWILDKEAVCHQCHKGAAQLIEISQARATITCTSCQGERHFTIHGVEAHCRMPGSGARGGRRSNTWDLRYTDHCVNCGNCVDNEVSVDEYRVKTMCPACCFTRVYEFDMFNESRARR